jgi:hypothetical protein
MKTMMLAAAAVFSLGVGAAYADGGDGPTADTLFTELPGVVAQAPVHAPSAVAANQSGAQIHTYVTQHSKGTWLFAPDMVGGGGNN